MAIVGTKDLATGVDWQDDQHKELFSRLDRLVSTLGVGGENKAAVEEAVSFLESYVNEHFGEEEREMERLNYSKKGTHMLQHSNFKYNLMYVKEAYGVKSNMEVIEKVEKELVDWFKEHITNVDTKLGAFLIDQAA